MTGPRNILMAATPRNGGLPSSAARLLLAIAVLTWPTSARADIDNTATASANYGGVPITSPPSATAVPVAPSAAAMTVTKTADVTAEAAAGQVITYTYVVTNTGNETLSGIQLNDSHNAAGPAPVPHNEVLSTDSGTANDSTDAITDDGVWTSLAPGDAVTFTATYTVTQADVDSLQ